MRVKNLSPKHFIIPVKNSVSVTLHPASGYINLPDGADESYLKKLAELGKIEIVAPIEKSTVSIDKKPSKK